MISKAPFLRLFNEHITFVIVFDLRKVIISIDLIPLGPIFHYLLYVSGGSK